MHKTVLGEWLPYYCLPEVSEEKSFASTINGGALLSQFLRTVNLDSTIFIISPSLS